MFTRTLSDQLTATIVLSLYNAAGFLGQIVIGHLTDRIPYPSVMAVSAVGSGIAAFVLWGLADRAIYLYFFAIVFGSLVGPLRPHSQFLRGLLTLSAHPIVERRILFNLDERFGRML